MKEIIYSHQSIRVTGTNFEVVGLDNPFSRLSYHLMRRHGSEIICRVKCLGTCHTVVKLGESVDLISTVALNRSRALHGLIEQVKITTTAYKRVLGQLVLRLGQRCRNHQSHLGFLQIFHILVKIILAGDRNNISVGVFVPEFNRTNLIRKFRKRLRGTFLKLREIVDVLDLFDLETVSEFHRRCHLILFKT